MNDLESIRAVLLESMDKSLAESLAAEEESNKLAQQKIMYSNDARGTLYSGQPTWERAQTAATHLQNISKIQENDLNQRVSIWNKIANTLDQINSYNKAAKTLTGSNGNTNTSYLELYNSLLGGNQ